MRIRIADPSLREGLVFHLERSGFAVEWHGDLMEVRRPDAPSSAERRREIELHLAVWLAMNPDASVEVLDG
jgi:hypothetical protein